MYVRGREECLWRIGVPSAPGGRPDLDYQPVGLRIVVPGIGSGSWLDASIPRRIGLTKFACCRSCTEGLRTWAPGITRPMTFWCFAFTIFKESTRSESFDTITAQS